MDFRFFCLLDSNPVLDTLCPVLGTLKVVLGVLYHIIHIDIDNEPNKVSPACANLQACLQNQHNALTCEMV